MGCFFKFLLLFKSDHCKNVQSLSQTSNGYWINLNWGVWSWCPVIFLMELLFCFLFFCLSSTVAAAPGAAAPPAAARTERALRVWVTQKTRRSTRTWRPCWEPASPAATRRSAECRGFGHGRGHGRGEEVRLTGSPGMTHDVVGAVKHTYVFVLYSYKLLFSLTFKTTVFSSAFWQNFPIGTLIQYINTSRHKRELNMWSNDW